VDDLLEYEWDLTKAVAVERAFWSFARNVRVDSKEKGANYRIIDGLYEGQKRFIHSIFHDALANNKHSVKWLKSRQLGVTTITEIFDVFWLGINDGMRGALIYDTTSHRESGRRRIKAIVNKLPKSYKFPRIKSDNRDGLSLENDSQLIFMSAGIRETSSSGVLGRSEGLNYWHRSELCSFENEEGLKSLNSSRSNTYPFRFYIDESTARKFNVWYDIWTAAKNNDLEEVCGFTGWWAKDDQRWRRGSPHFQRYGSEPPTDEEAKRINLVKDLYGFDIDEEQLAWYRWFVDPTRERDEGDPEDSYLLSDQPWTEDEAFQQAGSTFYRSDKIQQAQAYTTTIHHKAYRFWPGTNITECDFQQARYIRETELKLWEEPQAEATYVVSGDPAFGHDEINNNSCAQVVKCFADSCEQVAEFTSPLIEPHHFAWLLLSLVSYYASQPQNDVLMICELNGPGEEVWRNYKQTGVIIRSGYLHYAAKQSGLGNVSGNISNYFYTRSDSMHFGNSYQFKTNQQLKVQMMEGLRNNFHNNVILIRSGAAIEEMKTIVREGDKIGAAQKSGRDDMNFALALANRGWEERKRPTLIRQNRTREADKIRRSGTIIDRVALFNSNMIQDFLKGKEAMRRQARIASMQRSRW
jgi:hypothetical protein